MLNGDAFVWLTSYDPWDDPPSLHGPFSSIMYPVNMVIIRKKLCQELPEDRQIFMVYDGIC